MGLGWRPGGSLDLPREVPRRPRGYPGPPLTAPEAFGDLPGWLGRSFEGPRGTPGQINILKDVFVYICFISAVNILKDVSF